MLQSMEARGFVCFGHTKNPQATHTFHGRIWMAICFPRSPTTISWLCFQFVRRMTRIRALRRFLKITGLSRTTSDAFSKARVGRTSKRCRDTITTAGLLRATLNTVKTSRRITSRITSGLPCGQGACPRDALTKSAASSGDENIFFLHQ